MNWKQLLSAKRLGLEQYHSDKQDVRSEFERDYDRLIFSAPFRRLQNKTQVFPLPGSIFVHNRLTHSLEVSTVGRSLGSNVARGLRAKYPGSKAALDIGPIGKMLAPLGDLSFEEAYDIFAEEVEAGAEADLIVIETMSDLYETKAALLAAK